MLFKKLTEQVELSKIKDQPLTEEELKSVEQEMIFEHDNMIDSILMVANIKPTETK